MKNGYKGINSTQDESIDDISLNDQNIKLLKSNERTLSLLADIIVVVISIALFWIIGLGDEIWKIILFVIILSLGISLHRIRPEKTIRIWNSGFRIFWAIVAITFILFLAYGIISLSIWAKAAIHTENGQITNIQFVNELIQTREQKDCQVVYLTAATMSPQVFLTTYNISRRIRSSLTNQQLQEIKLAPNNLTEKKFIEGDLPLAIWMEGIFLKSIIRDFIPKSGCKFPDGYLQYMKFIDLERLSDSYSCETCEPYDIVMYQLEAIPKRFEKK
jgi:hypothetical protein